MKRTAATVRALVFAAASAIAGTPAQAEELYDVYAHLNLFEVKLRKWSLGPGAEYFSALERQDLPRAMMSAKTLAEDDDPFAQAFFGAGLYQIAATEGERNRAVTWLEKSAEQGNSMGQMFLAQAYSDGIDADDLEKAEQLMQAAAGQGSAIAMMELARSYYMGTFGAKDPSAETLWLTLSATIFGNLGAEAGSHYFWMAFDAALEARHELMFTDPAAYDETAQTTAASFKELADLAYANLDEAPEEEYWSGKYICGQGITGVTLIVRGSLAETTAPLDGVAHFFPVPENPLVPEGCSAGKLSAISGEDGARQMNWKPETWLKEIEGYSLTGGSTGEIQFGGIVGAGEIDHPLCTDVVIQQVLIPPHPIPAECTLR